LVAGAFPSSSYFCDPGLLFRNSEPVICSSFFSPPHVVLMQRPFFLPFFPCSPPIFSPLGCDKFLRRLPHSCTCCTPPLWAPHFDRVLLCFFFRFLSPLFFRPLGNASLSLPPFNFFFFASCNLSFFGGFFKSDLFDPGIPPVFQFLFLLRPEEQSVDPRRNCAFLIPPFFFLQLLRFCPCTQRLSFSTPISPLP